MCISNCSVVEERLGGERSSCPSRSEKSSGDGSGGYHRGDLPPIRKYRFLPHILESLLTIEQGGVVAYIAFHTRVLPNLMSVLPQSLHDQVEDTCYQLGGRNAPLRSDRSNPPISPRRTLLTPATPKQPLRRAAV